MAPKKDSKKTEEQLEGDIISDTTSVRVVHSVKSWAAIAEKMEDELSYADNGTDNHLRDIAETRLHKVTTRLRLVSYTDMVAWALDKVDVRTRSILNK
jgi:hypothetical protein